ncbi:3-hydroxy-3-methylglutaryl-CoA reductase [Candidatus Woesearchaeota archaeon]|nr:3-hydroxy-3-methylglutaryl-CoA reductase [Candidatus Woesearchaeota archaeon]
MTEPKRDAAETRIRCLEERTISLPTYIIGPLHVRGQCASGEYKIPLATAEVPLIPSTARGIKIANLCGGVETIVEKDEMTRAPLFSTTSCAKAEELCQYLRSNFHTLYEVVARTTTHGKLMSIEALQHVSDAYVRIGMFCADAAGHNMTTKAAQYIWEHIRSLPQFQNDVDLLTVSSNYCTDKKPARVNVEKGRGKTVLASLHIPRDILEKNLHTTAQRLEDVNYKKNCVGSRLAGCVGGNNAHHANIVAAMYLAFGQDVANVVEGSLGSTSVKCNDDGSATFAVHLPALIVGTIGGGTKLPHAKQNLETLGLYGSGDPPGSNAKALAEIITAAVLAGELSLMAALSNNGEHWRAHQRFERG